MYIIQSSEENNKNSISCISFSIPWNNNNINCQIPATETQREHAM